MCNNLTDSPDKLSAHKVFFAKLPSYASSRLRATLLFWSHVFVYLLNVSPVFALLLALVWSPPTTTKKNIYLLDLILCVPATIVASFVGLQFGAGQMQLTVIFIVD